MHIAHDLQPRTLPETLSGPIRNCTNRGDAEISENPPGPSYVYAKGVFKQVVHAAIVRLRLIIYGT